MNPYESQRLVDEYLLFHYGGAGEILEWDFGPRNGLDFALRTVRDTFLWQDVPPDARALDVGCAVGRSSFELASYCSEVIGIDYSRAFIAAAETLRRDGETDYRRLEEARISTSQTARVPDGIDRSRVRFEVGDATMLGTGLGRFDVLHAANLLCRLPEPTAFTAQLAGLVKPGGQCVLTTPCTWLEEFTPVANWPRTTTLDYLQDQLGADFDRARVKEMPFLIREHRRKFQWTVAQASLWLRKG